MKKKLTFLTLILFLSSFSSTSYYGKDVELEKLSRVSFKKCSEKIAQDYHIKFMNIGLGDMIDQPKILWCAKFLIQRPMTKEEMQPVVIDMFSRLWKTTYKDPIFNDFLILHAKVTNQALENCALQKLTFSSVKPIEKKTPRPLTPNIIGIKIVFWDQNVNRPLHPYLAQVSVKDSKIHYYYADPKTQALLEPPLIEDLPEEILKTDQ